MVYISEISKVIIMGSVSPVPELKCMDPENYGKYFQEICWNSNNSRYRKTILAEYWYYRKIYMHSYWYVFSRFPDVRKSHQWSYWKANYLLLTHFFWRSSAAGALCYLLSLLIMFVFQGVFKSSNYLMWFYPWITLSFKFVYNHWYGFLVKFFINMTIIQ